MRNRVRRRLMTTALAMLLWQLVVAAMPPLALCCAPNDSFAEAAICTCDHADDGACPMRHAGDGSERPVDPNTPRWCAGCGDPLQALAALMEHAGAPPEEPWRTQPIDSPASALRRAAPSIRAVHGRVLAPPPKV